MTGFASQSARIGLKTSITTAPSGPGRRGVRDVAQDAPGSAGAEDALVGSDPERHLPGDHHPVLLVRMPMLRHDRARIELDNRQGDPIAFHPTGANPIEDLDRHDLGQGRQIVHRRIVATNRVPWQTACSSHRMTTDENKRVIRRFIHEILAAGRVEAVDELVAPDFVSHTWDMTDAGRDRLKETTPQMHARLSDIEMTIDDLVAEDDRVVARLTSSATPTGDFMGVPAAGKRYTIGELHLFRVRDGKVVEHWHQIDGLGLMRQLGAGAATRS